MYKYLLTFTFVAFWCNSKSQDNVQNEIKRLYTHLKKIDSLPGSLISARQDCFVFCEIFLKGQQIDSLIFSGCDNPEVKEIVRTSVMNFRFNRNSKIACPVIIPFLFKIGDKGDNINMDLKLREMDLKKLLPLNNKYQVSTAIILPAIYVLHYAERKTVN